MNQIITTSQKVEDAVRTKCLLPKLISLIEQLCKWYHIDLISGFNKSSIPSTGTLLRQDYIDDTDGYFSWASEIYHSYVDKPIAISSAIFLVSQLEKIMDNQCIKFFFLLS